MAARDRNPEETRVFWVELIAENRRDLEHVRVKLETARAILRLFRVLENLHQLEPHLIVGQNHTARKLVRRFCRAVRHQLEVIKEAIREYSAELAALPALTE